MHLYFHSKFCESHICTTEYAKQNSMPVHSTYRLSGSSWSMHWQTDTWTHMHAHARVRKRAHTLVCCRPCRLNFYLLLAFRVGQVCFKAMGWINRLYFRAQLTRHKHTHTSTCPYMHNNKIHNDLKRVGWDNTSNRCIFVSFIPHCTCNNHSKHYPTLGSCYIHIYGLKSLHTGLTSHWRNKISINNRDGF